MLVKFLELCAGKIERASYGAFTQNAMPNSRPAQDESPRPIPAPDCLFANWGEPPKPPCELAERFRSAANAARRRQAMLLIILGFTAQQQQRPR
jgi:hypothetical protein